MTVNTVLEGMVWVLVLLAMQVGVCLPLEANLDVVSRILHEVPLIDGHNDLPWNIRKFLKNQLKDFRFSEDLREVAPWSRSAWSHTDLGRLRKGMVAAQFWSAYVPCSSQHLDSVQLTLEQIDVIRRLVAKYPGHMALVTTAQGIKRAHESGRIASLIGIEGGHAIGTSLGVLRMFYQLGARYLTITHTCNTPCQKPVPAYLNFLFGGLSGMSAAAVVHPFDVVKNGMQLAAVSGAPSSLGDVVGSIMKNYGIPGLYKGLTATLLRQATYTTARLGVFNVTLNLMTGADGTPPNFAVKAGLGLLAGACGAIVGTPADLCLVRMTADARLPPEQRRNYSNVINGIVRIISEEGVLTLWRGCFPTVVRACVVNASQLATYTQAKQMLLQTPYFQEGLMTHFGASMISGLCTTITSMPVDILKTRLQNMKVVNGVPEYSGSMDAFMKVIGKEGVFALWRGFVPYYMRLGPHTVLMFIFMEQMMTAYKKY